MRALNISEEWWSPRLRVSVNNKWSEVPHFDSSIMYKVVVDTFVKSGYREAISPEVQLSNYSQLSLTPQILAVHDARLAQHYAIGLIKRRPTRMIVESRTWRMGGEQGQGQGNEVDSTRRLDRGWSEHLGLWICGSGSDVASIPFPPLVLQIRRLE